MKKLGSNAFEPADRRPGHVERSHLRPRVSLLNQAQATAGGPPQIGLLLSGGLDSAVLLGRMLVHERRVVPFYVRTGCVWQDRELRAVRELLSVLGRPNLAELVVLDMPVGDLYDDHWSMSGRAVPDQRTGHEAVFLPGRNPLLLIKPVLWCQLHGVPQLALATLAGNPFDDAAPEFFARFQAMMRQATGAHVEVIRPLERMTKREVMLMGRELPLEMTFSCLAPVDDLHCGRCNKCAERAKAFGHFEAGDPTCYAYPLASDEAHVAKAGDARRP